jgi:HK97 family phage prohead protease
MPQRARDTHISAVVMLAPSIEPTIASVFAARTTIEPDGTVEGYASLFGEIDQSRDMVMAGAFAATLRQRTVQRVPMLFQHDPAEPVGVWLELREDGKGLYARGRLIPEVARGRELLSLLRAGAIDGLSIGFRTVRGRIDPKTRVRRLLAVDLWEISIVTFPLLAGARVRAVKQAAPSQPRLSRPRMRAEQDWRALMAGLGGEAAAAPRAPVNVVGRRRRRA